MALPDRLRSLIRWRGLTHKQFAAETGIPYQTLRPYLDGRSVPGGDHIQRLMHAQIDVGWLLTGRNSGPQSEFVKGPSDFPGYGDVRFLNAAALWIIRGLKMLSEDRIEKGKPPLPWVAVEPIAAELWQGTLDTAERVWTRLEELGAKGPPPETLAEMVLFHGEPPASYWAWIEAGGAGWPESMPVVRAADLPMALPRRKPGIKRRGKRKVRDAAGSAPEIPAGWPMATKGPAAD